MVRWNKFCLSGLCQNSVLAPYCKDWEPRYSTNTSERLQFPWISHRTPPRHPPDNPKASPGNITCQKTTTDTNRHCQTPQDTAMCHVLECAWQCLLGPVVVCCCQSACRVPWVCLELPGGCLVRFSGYLGGIYENKRRWDVFGGFDGFSVLAIWSQHTILAQPWKAKLFSPDHTETLKYQNGRI